MYSRDGLTSVQTQTDLPHRSELSIHEGCLLWGNRVIIPSSCRDAVLTELHEGHAGVTHMKSLARMYVWWPGITKDIEHTVRQCQLQSPVAPLHPWSWLTRPWARLHLDYSEEMDAHSKWIEAIFTRNATSFSISEELRSLLAQFGLPKPLITDNGTCFVSAEFEAFLADNGIKHLTSATYHLTPNGWGEHAVQIIKKGLRKITQSSMRTRLAKIIFTNRLSRGISPVSYC